MVEAVVVFGQVVEGHHIGVWNITWNELVHVGCDLRLPAFAVKIQQDAKGAQNGVGCESFKARVIGHLNLPPLRIVVLKTPAPREVTVVATGMVFAVLGVPWI